MDPETRTFPVISKKWIALAATLGVGVLGVGVVAARAIAHSDGSVAAVMTGGSLSGPEGRGRENMAAHAPSAQAAQAAANQRRLERMLGVGPSGVAAPVVMPVNNTESRGADPSHTDDNAAAAPMRIRDTVRENEAVNLVRSRGSLGSCVEVARLRNPANLRGRARLVINVGVDGSMHVEVRDAPDEHLASCIERSANVLHLTPGAAVTAETEFDLD